MHRNLSKYASQVKRSVHYFLIFIFILSGVLDLLIFSTGSMVAQSLIAIKILNVIQCFPPQYILIDGYSPITPKIGFSPLNNAKDTEEDLILLI